MPHSGLEMSLASSNWERSPQCYLSKQNLCNTAVKPGLGTLGILLKQKSSDWLVISEEIWIFNKEENLTPIGSM